MTLKSNTFNAGTNGASVTAASTASSGDQLAISAGTGGTITYSNAYPAHGGMGILLNPSTPSCVVLYNGYTASSMAIRRYLSFTALPSGTIALFGFFNAGSTQIFTPYITSTGTVAIVTPGGTVHTSSATLSINTTYRLEAAITPGTSTSNGYINFAMYAGDSTTALDTYTSSAANLGTTTISAIQFGRTVGSSNTFSDYMDDVAANDGTTSFIGPASTNVAPTANAGADQSGITAGATVTLDGTASSDSDGTIASYAWTQTAGTTVTLSSTTVAQPTFTAPSVSGGTTLTFSLVVTDNSGTVSSADTVTIGVASTSSATIYTNNFEGQTDGTSATASNSTTSGFALAFNRGTNSTTTYSSAHPAHGSMGMLMASGSSAACAANVTISSAASVAIARAFYTDALPSADVEVLGSNGVNLYVTSTGAVKVLDAGGGTLYTSSALLAVGTQYRLELVVVPNASTTGGTVKFQAASLGSSSAISGAAYSSTAANAGTASATSIRYGRNDAGNSGAFNDYGDDFRYATGTTDFLGPVTNAAPVANAGADQTNVEPWTTVTLNGSASSDSDGTVTGYAWTQTTGTTVSLSNSTVAQPTFTAPGTLAGDTLTFSLIVTDNSGLTSSADTVNVTVLYATERAILGGVQVPARLSAV